MSVEAYEYSPYGVPTIHSREADGSAQLRVWDEAKVSVRAAYGTLSSNAREGVAAGALLAPAVRTTQSARAPLSAAQSSIGLKFLFTARPWTPVGELYHLRARWYSPLEGRFLTMDPIGYDGGSNVYMYCGGDPVNWVDPWGLRMASIMGAFLDGCTNGYTGWSATYIWAMSGFQTECYTDWSDPEQAWGGACGFVSWGASCFAVGLVSGGSGSGVNFRLLGPNSLVPVTSWAPAGVTPTIGTGRWVMLGVRSRANHIASGVVEYGYPYVNSVTKMVKWGQLGSPAMDAKVKWFLGQRVIKSGVGLIGIIGGSKGQDDPNQARPQNHTGSKLVDAGIFTPVSTINGYPEGVDSYGW